MYKIIDDLFNDEEKDGIESSLLDSNFPWYYVDRTVENNISGEEDSPFVSHAFMRNGEVNSDWANLPMLIYSKIDNKKYSKVYRMNGNMMFPTKAGNTLPRHKDFGQREVDNEEVMIYYVNDSDGNTVLYMEDGNKVEVEPKKGRVLIFDANLYHAGTPPSKGARVVINFNMIRKPVFHVVVN